MLFLTLVLFVAVLLGLNYLYRSTQKLGQTVFVGLLLGLVSSHLKKSKDLPGLLPLPLQVLSGNRHNTFL